MVYVVILWTDEYKIGQVIKGSSCAHCEVLFQYLSGRTEDNHENLITMLCAKTWTQDLLNTLVLTIGLWHLVATLRCHGCTDKKHTWQTSLLLSLFRPHVSGTAFVCQSQLNTSFYKSVPCWLTFIMWPLKCQVSAVGESTIQFKWPVQGNVLPFRQQGCTLFTGHHWPCSWTFKF